MTAPAHQKFDFGTVFGDTGAVIAKSERPKRSYTPDEVEAIRQEAYRSGQRDAEALAQQVRAQHIQALADAAQAGLATVSEAIFDQKRAATGLCLSVARKLAGRALEQYPEAVLLEAMDALSTEIAEATRLSLYVPNLDDNLKDAANEAAILAGFEGQISFRERPSYPAGAFEIVWHEGRAEFNPDRAFEAIVAAIDAQMASEQHHLNADHGENL